MELRGHSFKEGGHRKKPGTGRGKGRHRKGGKKRAGMGRKSFRTSNYQGLAKSNVLKKRRDARRQKRNFGNSAQRSYYPKLSFLLGKEPHWSEESRKRPSARISQWRTNDLSKKEGGKRAQEERGAGAAVGNRLLQKETIIEGAWKESRKKIYGEGEFVPHLFKKGDSGGKGRTRQGKEMEELSNRRRMFL